MSGVYRDPTTGELFQVPPPLPSSPGAGGRTAQPMGYLPPGMGERLMGLAQFMGPGADMQDAFASSGGLVRAMMGGDFADAGLQGMGLAAALGSAFLPGPSAGDLLSKGVEKTGDLVAGSARNPKIGSMIRGVGSPDFRPTGEVVPEPNWGAEFTGGGARDPEGRELRARFVVGRHDEGGPDRALAADEARAVVVGLTGSPPQLVPRSQIRELADGSYHPRYDVTRVAGDMNDEDTAAALRHELGHAIDTRVRRGVGVGAAGIGPELQALYTTGARSVMPDHISGVVTPESFRYPKSEHRGEYLSEAMRLYMTNPEFLKKAAPKTAKRIRDAVNENPRLRDWIQFNALALTAGGAGLGALQSQPPAQDR